MSNSLTRKAIENIYTEFCFIDHKTYQSDIDDWFYCLPFWILYFLIYLYLVLYFFQINTSTTLINDLNTEIANNSKQSAEISFVSQS